MMELTLGSADVVSGVPMFLSDKHPSYFLFTITLAARQGKGCHLCLQMGRAEV